MVGQVMEERTIARKIFWTPRTLTVLVPALNEENNLRGTVDRLLKALSITVEDFEILIVNDGSTDGTGAVADELAAGNPKIRALHNTERMGLGGAYQRGVAEASEAYFVYIPGDNTWPYRSFLELFGNLGKADVVTSYTTNPNVRPWGRRIVSRLYTKTLNFLHRQQMNYYNGLTIYPLSFLRSVDISTKGFGFQAEILLKALYRGLSVVEVALPIDERTAGSSKAVNLKNITSVALTILRLFWRLRLGFGKKKTVTASSHWRSETNAGVEEIGLRTGLNGHVHDCHQRPHIALAQEPTTWPNADNLAMRPDRSLNIIITGASSGIGAALALALASDGHVVFACARRKDKLETVFHGVKGVHGWVCDVSDEKQVKDFLAKVESHTSKVDALINCAGTFGCIGPVESTESEDWLNTVKINLFGPYLMAKHSQALLAKGYSPRIINLAGGGAFSSFPNYSAYACSKAALVRFTECLAAELAPRGIAVNALAPGFVATEAHAATLRAGELKAGPLQYRRTLAVMSEGGAPMAQVVDCTRALLSVKMEGLTGKTISANFDPWCTQTFLDHLSEITRSDLYTSRRYNIVNLPAGSLRGALSNAWANYATQV
jgi:NAD(P)-dependent dehydrogenase (short-subunit alcohol dehydrogenase family)